MYHIHVAFIVVQQSCQLHLEDQVFSVNLCVNLTITLISAVSPPNV